MARASRLVYECPRAWGDLGQTALAGVRYCDHCKQHVHRVVDAAGLNRSIAAGQCVLIDIPGEPLMMGRPRGTEGGDKYDVTTEYPLTRE
jgi:hypothetical protein